MNPIFLIGMPGSGKSTLGRALAKKAELQFIDLDQYIQGRYFCSVSDIFAKWGEARFREIEFNLLHEVGEMQDVVIACGGGTPCFFDNMDYMLSRGEVVYLMPSRERLHERLCRGRKRRPAIATLSDEEIYVYIDDTLASRGEVYMRAHHAIESSQLEDRDSIDATAAHCIAILSDNNSN